MLLTSAEAGVAAATVWLADGFNVILERALLAHADRLGANSAAQGVPEVSHWFWAVGVLITLVGATLTVLGFMLQKLSHQHKDGAGPCYCSDWRWAAGLALWVVGQAVCWLADGLAPRSVLACFNCWNIVVVFALAPPCFGEVVDRKAAIGAMVTVLGCVWVVLAGPRGYQAHTVHSLNKAWHGMPLFYLVGSTGVYLAATGICSQLRSTPLAQSSPVELASLSAAFAWYAVLFSKCVSTLIVTTATHENQMIYWEFWLFLAGLLVCAALQIHTLNLALKVGRSVDVLPTYEALSMTGQIVICGVFFSEFRGYSSWGVVVFAAGVSCVLAGVVALVRFGREVQTKGEDTPLRAAAMPGAAAS